MSSHAVYLLLKLVHEHPAMRGVVSKEVRQLLARTDTSIRCIYYGVSFLNQLEFTSDDNDLAAELVLFYFLLFKKYSILALEEQSKQSKNKKKDKKGKDKKGKKNSNTEKVEGSPELRLKLISAILTGINRALPYGQGNESA